MTTENHALNHVEPTEADPLTRSNQDEEEQEPTQTFREKVWFMITNITIEPVLFLALVANMLTLTAGQNLMLEKACRVNLNFPKNVCDSLMSQELDNENEFEREAQRLYSQFVAWSTYITATLPCFLILLIGAFSDQTGYRKFFIIVSLCGQVLSGVNALLNIYFFNQLPLQVLIFTDAIIHGLIGPWSISMTAIAFISAISTPKTRTFRLGMLSLCVSVAFPIGLLLSGILLKGLGYYGSYGMATSLYCLNVLYLIIVVKDPERTLEQKQHAGKGIWHLICQFFKISNVKDTLSVIVRNGPNNRRLRLLLLLPVVIVVYGPVPGEMAVLYMTTRYRFGWDEVKYSVFLAYNFVMNFAGTSFAIFLFSKKLQWHDALIGIIAAVSKIAASFVMCFAPNEKIFLIAPAVEILAGTSLLTLRSIITKLVEPQELGKITSAIVLMEIMTPLMYVPLYTKVYSITIETLPGAVFLLSAILIVPAVIVLVWVFYQHRRQLQKKPTLEEDYTR